ncbi:MAG: type I-B CRISPR-associated protein Cas7/Csh2 [Syntrophomonas sp.]
MAFNKRREYLFLYSVKDANPNGDPLNENHPRYDEDTQQAMVSDVRIKRTIRDEWVRKNVDNQHVFIDGEAKTLQKRFEELKTITQQTEGPKVMQECIDTRLFGVTFALGDKHFAWTGPVQFKWGRSLHAATFKFIQGTAAFATSETSQQRSFRNEYIVPFALMAVYGIANQYPSEITTATDIDLDIMREALWEGTNNLITRSKNEHKSRLLLEITYKENYKGKIGSLDERVKLTKHDGSELSSDQQKSLRSLREVQVQMKNLIESIVQKIDNIDEILLIKDADLLLPETKTPNQDTIIPGNIKVFKEKFGDKFKLELR